MGRDNYLVRIERREGARVALRAVVSGNGGFSGEPRPGGRSFALLMAGEADPTALGAPAEWSPLFRCLVDDASARGAVTDCYLQVWEMLRDASWVEANIDRYVRAIVVTRARILAGDWEDERAFDAWLREQAADDEDLFRSLLWKWAPYFDCEVEFVDAAYAMHLSPGRELATAAYASWREGSSARLSDAPRTALEVFGVGSDGRPL